MFENQITPELGNQQNQPLEDNLSDNQITGNYQAEESENRDEYSQKEFPERTQQHDYQNPSANHDEEEIDEDELNTEGEAFGPDYENNTNLPDEQPTDVSKLGLV